MNYKLSIGIPVFNKLSWTQSCLKDLSKLSLDHEIIIIDNGSADGTSEFLEEESKKIPNLIFLKNEKNRGFAQACNQSYAIASAPNVLFLNNDIRVKSNFENWTAPLIEEGQAGLVGPTMGLLDSQFNFVKESNGLLAGNSYVSGWCICASKEIWNQLVIPRTGLMSLNGDAPQVFSEEFGIAYFEDTDLGFRARKQNIKMSVVDIPVVHFGKQTSSQLNTYALYKGAREIFIKKWKKK